MAIAIPAALNGLKPLRRGYGVQAAPLIVSSVDAGPPKQRASDTTDRETIAAVFRFKRSDYEANFLPFYRDTLKKGALAFDWVEPVSARACEARFDGSSPPGVVFVPGGRVEVSVRLVVLY